MTLGSSLAYVAGTERVNLTSVLLVFYGILIFVLCLMNSYGLFFMLMSGPCGRPPYGE